MDSDCIDSVARSAPAIPAFDADSDDVVLTWRWCYGRRVRFLDLKEHCSGVLIIVDNFRVPTPSDKRVLGELVF